jgi:hypothetical protein
VTETPEEEQGQTEPDGTATPADGSDAEVAPPEHQPVRGQRGKLVKARASDLGDFHLMHGNLPGESIEVVIRGDKIGSDGGSATVVGTMIQKIGQFIGSIAGTEPYVESLAFGNSVHITLRPRLEDVEAAREQFTRVRSVIEHAEVPPEGTVRELLFEDTVPTVEAAVVIAADLIAQSADDAPAEAVQYGAEVARTYKAFASSVARNELTVAFDVPDRERPVTLGAEKAGRVNDALRDMRKPRTYEIEVFGTLSIADAIQHGFGLRLERRGQQPRVIRGRRLIRGPFTPQVEDSIRKQGLWGNRVRARIRVEEDAIVSTSTVRPPTFTLVHVEPAA